jgi:hypothetical protein
MHNLSSSFVLGYHGCERETGERLLANAPFRPSTNDYDWLGSGVYFWEANPDRALEWAKRTIDGRRAHKDPFVVGAVIDPGYCLDLISTNGIEAVASAYEDYAGLLREGGMEAPRNSGGPDFLLRKLDCVVINFLHRVRHTSGDQPFDTVRGVFTEGEHIYENSGFRRKTHIQICVRNTERINGVFRVPERHFTGV